MADKQVARKSTACENDLTVPNINCMVPAKEEY